MIRPALPAAAFAALVIAAPAVSLVATPTVVLAQAARGHGDAEAEAFVQNQASRVLQILSDKSLSLDAKKQNFHQIVDQIVDVPRVTNFVLGRYRRILTPTQYAAFAAAFRDYADNVYESHLGQYSGQTLKVTGSTVRQPGDVVVTSQVIGHGAPEVVNWRVLRGGDGAYKAVDVEVAGVWLAITEQQDFVATLDNHNGDVNVLIKQLRHQGGGR